MRIAPFALERYFAKHEFCARYLLSSSDCESLSLTELLAMADPETTALWKNLRLGYTETPGHPLLRKEIARLYRGIVAQNILVTVPEEGIFLLMHALLSPGDHIVCTFPGYQSLYEVARSIGCDVSVWEPDENRGWCFDPGQLEKMIRPDTRMVVVNFPHNPTGSVPSRNDFEKIVDLVSRHGTYLLSDEMYRFLEIEEGYTLPSACELYDRAFTLCGLSKSFGLPGLRIGWLASHRDKELERVSMLRDFTTICSSAPSEILAVMALRSRKSIIQTQLKRVRRNVKLLDSFFSEYEDFFRWNRPAGGSVCFPRMLIDHHTGTFCERLIEETGIMLVPSSIFQYGENHIRIGFGRDDLAEVIEMFSGYLAKQYR
jgi:aspartate/methionine/tyrosine aminotransferase